MELALHFDLRAPEIGPSVDELYRAAIEQCAWAEKRGFDTAWDSLELFVEKVLPAIKPAAVPPLLSEGAG